MRRGREEHEDDSGFAPIAGVLGDILKKARQLEDLRMRLEAERGPISDEEFLKVVDAMGITL
jgi:hypothetical protein